MTFAILTSFGSCALAASPGSFHATSHSQSLNWSVKKLQFSAVSMGVAMKDELTGWSSFTNGAEPIQITQTKDGGNTWAPVASQPDGMAMIMGNDVSATASSESATTSPSTSSDVVYTGLFSTSFSLDGEHFNRSAGGGLISQSIKAYPGGRVALATSSGVCTSTNNGATFSCHTVPFKAGPMGRYVSWPSPDTIYVTAGTWPESKANPATSSETPHQLTAILHLHNHSLNGLVHGGPVHAGSVQTSTQLLRLTADLEMPATKQDVTATSRKLSTNDGDPPPTGYIAELWKSSDGGKTWRQLMADSGKFYLNDIDCADESHCVTVGEGFGKDGSTDPGARVYVSTDGEKFGLAHHETTDGSSLMAVKALSTTEHHVGGRLEDGISLHSADGGKTYEKLGADIRGQMITSLSFPTPNHAFATSVNALQICSLLELK